MNWEKVSLGELCDIKGGVPAPQNNDAFEDGEIPFVRMKDLGRYHLTNNLDKVDQKLSRKEFDSKRYELIPKGSILMPRSGSVALNHRAILGIDAVVVSHICALVIKSKRIDNRFLYYLLTQTDMRKFTKKTTGLDSINFTDIRKLQIPLLPLSEQKRIVEVLDKADALREKRRLALQRLDALLQSVFLEMFGKGQDIYSKWRISTLGDVITRITNGYVGPTRDIYLDEGIPYILAKHLFNHEVNFCNKVFVSEGFNEKNKKSKLKRGDVLIVQSGVNTGNTAVVSEKHEGHNCHALIVITPITEAILGEYLSYFLQSEAGNKKLKQIETGATIQPLKALC